MASDVTDDGVPLTGESNSESTVEAIVAAYVDRLNLGEELSSAEILVAHPELGPEILEHLQVFLEAASGSGDDESLGTIGDYRLLRQIGRGGMGVVYEAWEGSMDRPVALKVLPAGIAVDTKAVTRFIREAQVAGKLHHPNVVAVHGMGVKDQIPYYAMEYVEGETLAEVLESLRATGGKEQDRRAILENLSQALGKSEPADTAPQPASDVFKHRTLFGSDGLDLRYYANLAHAFAGVADGLQHAHSRNVIHRDIKPSNLILDLEGHLRILDFGLAHLEGQESLTASGALIGTPLYMSPEQTKLRRIAIDQRTDIYSLGATMYEMLTCRPPFRGKDYNDTLWQIVERDPVEPVKLNPRIPGDLETIVLKCLRKEPGDRYGTAEALGQDLRRFVRGDPIEARPQAALELFLRRWRRHGRRIVVGLCACLFLVVTAALFQQYRSKQREEDEAKYAEIVQTAALTLQRETLVSNEHAGNVDLLEPRVSVALRYCMPDLFSDYELAPPTAVVDSLEDAIRLVPERPEAFYYLARALVLRNRREPALEYLSEALRRDASFAPARFLRNELLGRSDEELTDEATERAWQGEWLQAHLALKRFAWTEAAEAFDRLHDRYRRGVDVYLGAEAESWLGAAKAHLGANDLDHAIDDLTVAHHYLWPGARQPTLLLAKAYYLAGDTRRAEETFQEFDRISGGEGSGAVLIGAMYLSMGDIERALDWVERIKDPVHKSCAKSATLIFKEMPEEALDWARKAVELGPDRPWCHVVLGSALGAQGRYAEAVEAYEESIALDPNYAPAYAGLGLALCGQERWDEGIDHFERAIDLDPGYVDAHYQLGRALMLHGELKRAEATLKRALKIYPTYASFHTALGYVYMNMDRHDEAIACHQNAIRLNPRHAPARIHLAIAYARKDQAAEAVAAFARGIPLNPYTPFAYEDLIALFLRSDRLECSDELSALIAAIDARLPDLDGHPVEPRARAAYILACLHLGTEEAVASALAMSQIPLAQSDAQHPDPVVAGLAEVLGTAGETASAEELLRRVQELCTESSAPR